MEASSGCLLPQNSDSDGVRDLMVAGKQKSCCSSGTVSQHAQVSSCALLDPHHSNPQPSRIPDAVRFMGQYPDDMVRAERSLRGLRCVMEAIKDLQGDLLNARMPGVLLEVEKCHKLWSDLFLSQMMPADFLELCQIAATQQNRCSLFVEPFQ